MIGPISPVVMHKIEETIFLGRAFDICKVNGLQFALLNKEVKSPTDVTISLKDYHVILLSKIVAMRNIYIEARSVTILNAPFAIEGQVTIQTVNSYEALNMGNLTDHMLLYITDKQQKYYQTSIEHLSNIRELFNQGVIQRNGHAITNTLVEMFKLIDVPFELSLEGEVTTAMKFLTLSLE